MMTTTKDTGPSALLSRNTAPLTMPGQLHNVDGTRLHLHTMGEGVPSVVLIGGAGGPALVWALVQPEVARFTRVISDDRAGYGWSDAASTHEPRTAQRAATELHTLLHAAGIQPPYVLVGHSFGGYIARLFATDHPDEVAGVVLVDASHEDEWSERYPEAQRKGMRLVTRMMRLFALLSGAGIPQLLARFGLMPMEGIEKLPPGPRRR